MAALDLGLQPKTAFSRFPPVDTPDLKGSNGSIVLTKPVKLIEL
jgi:hypothetical protein